MELPYQRINQKKLSATTQVRKGNIVFRTHIRNCNQKIIKLKQLKCRWLPVFGSVQSVLPGLDLRFYYCSLQLC